MSGHARPPISSRAGDDRRRGFTIVEVVLAVGILVLGASAILGILTFGAALTRAAELRTAAAAATEAVDADLDRVLFPFKNGEVGEPVEIVEREIPDSPGVVYSAKATQNPDAPREYRVDVQMTWKSAGVQRSREYSMLRLREISFGDRMRRQFVEPPEADEPESEPESSAGPGVADE